MPPLAGPGTREEAQCWASLEACLASAGMGSEKPNR